MKNKNINIHRLYWKATNWKLPSTSTCLPLKPEKIAFNEYNGLSTWLWLLNNVLYEACLCFKTKPTYMLVYVERVWRIWGMYDEMRLLSFSLHFSKYFFLLLWFWDKASYTEAGLNSLLSHRWWLEDPPASASIYFITLANNTCPHPYCQIHEWKVISLLSPPGPFANPLVGQGQPALFHCDHLCTGVLFLLLPHIQFILYMEAGTIFDTHKRDCPSSFFYDPDQSTNFSPLLHSAEYCLFNCCRCCTRLSQDFTGILHGVLVTFLLPG